MKAGPRIEFSPQNAARKVLRKLTPTKEFTLEEAKAQLRREGVKLPPTSIGRLRSEIMRERGLLGVQEVAPSNGVVHLDESHIPLVIRTAKTVGGLDKLDRIIGIIRKAREL